MTRRDALALSVGFAALVLTGCKPKEKVLPDPPVPDASDRELIFPPQSPHPRFNPRRDPSSPSGYYIPRDVEEAARELLDSVSDEWKDYVRARLSGSEQIAPLGAYESDFVTRRFEGTTLSRWLMLSWLMPDGSPLSAFFQSKGVTSKFVMKGIVMVRVRRALLGQPFDWDEAVRSQAFRVRFDKGGWLPDGGLRD